MTDLRIAVRTLLKSPGWTAVVLMSLALGIGANTALFSAVDALMLKKLPVRDPDSLVRFRAAGRNQLRTDVLSYGFIAPDAGGRRVESSFSLPLFRELVSANRTLTDLAACAPIQDVNVVVEGHADIATAFLSTGSYYQVLGVDAELGRTIGPTDDSPSASPVAVISHHYWTSRFGADPGVIGKVVRVASTPVAIVGVMPAAFTGVQRLVDETPDVSMPMSLEPLVTQQRSIIQRSLLDAPNFWWIQIVGRLKPDSTLAQARANFAGVFQAAARSEYGAFLSSRSAEERSDFSPKDPSAIPELMIDPANRGIYEVDAASLRQIVLVGVALSLVLLIVCANVANLLLARATARQRELPVRLALGATPARLARQLLTESLLLSAAGGALGLLIAKWSAPLLAAGGAAPPLDWRVLIFTACVSGVTGLVFGMAPALRAAGADINGVLHRQSRSLTRSTTRLGKSLVVVQVTASLVLLVGAGLFMRTVQNLQHVDPGFNPENVVIFGLRPVLSGYKPEQRAALYAAVGDRLRHLGGIRSVAWSNAALMAGREFQTRLFVAGRAYAAGSGDDMAGMSVSPAFFDTMEIPALAGRGFTDRDTRDAPKVAILNHAAAMKYFPNVSAIGQRFGFSRTKPDETEIVGVVGDAKYDDLRAPAPPTVYSPYDQSSNATATFEVRTAGDPLKAIPAVRDAVRTVDPNVPLITATTQRLSMDERFTQERFFARAGAIFGGLALLVSSIGLFGLMSYSVARRTNEIGVRMALGAAGGDVVRLVMRESMTLVLAGLALGLAGAVAESRVMSSLLFGLAPVDPVAIAGAMIAMTTLAALAGYLPARRAARVDPMVALRDE